MPRCFVIAEAGVNHNGSVDNALRLIDVAVAAGADAVKFQTFKADALVTGSAPKADYQKAAAGSSGDTQHAMLRALELDPAAHERMSAHCAAAGIEFMSTPFDLASIDVLVQLGVRRLKVPSGEMTNGAYLVEMGRRGLPLVVSTGMCTLDEILDALAVIAWGMCHPVGRPDSLETCRAIAGGSEARRLLGERVTVLQCTTEYPAPFAEINLKAIDAIAAATGLPVGLSDHSTGIAMPIAAVARGAVMIEKHFTLDRGLPGPDHAASLEPGELAAMVEGIRAVEAALGDGIKRPTASELRNRPVARRSLVAARPIAAGEVFTAEALTAKRPGTGMAPMRLWELIGRPARRAYALDDLIDE